MVCMTGYQTYMLNAPNHIRSSRSLIVTFGAGYQLFSVVIVTFGANVGGTPSMVTIDSSGCEEHELS